MTDVFLLVTIAMVALVFLSFILPDKRTRASANVKAGVEGEKAGQPVLVE
jgi:hypothetical protein